MTEIATTVIGIDVVMERLSTCLDRLSVTRLRLPSVAWCTASRCARISVVVMPGKTFYRPREDNEVQLATLKRCIVPHFTVSTLYIDGGFADHFYIEAIAAISNARVAADLSALTVPLLKEQLRANGLLVSGRRQELIDRLLAAADGGAAGSAPAAPTRSSEAAVKHLVIFNLPFMGSDPDCDTLIRAIAPLRGSLRSLHIVAKATRDDWSRADWAASSPNHTLEPLLGVNERRHIELSICHPASLRAVAGFESLVALTLDRCDALSDIAPLAR